MDDLEYLQPSFDPSSLTMPRLRNILMTHDISYPASAKKNQLVDIFLQELKPQARKILSARERVRRTSAGITNMPSQSSTQPSDDEDDVKSMPPPHTTATPRQRTSRKSTRVSTEESSVEPSVPTTLKKSTGRKTTSRNPRQSDTENEPDQLSKATTTKPRKSGVAKEIKKETPDPPPVRPTLPESAFSDENPFQSGSSPLTEEASRRKTVGANNKVKRSSSERRKTDGDHLKRVPPSNGTLVSSRTLEIPASQLGSRLQEDQDEVEAGEEFTPEETGELVRQQEADGSRALATRPRKKRAASRVPKSAPWVVLTSLLVGFATWYRQDKIAVGYCGVGRPSDFQLQLPAPVAEWASALQPTCEPCPQHATCYEGFETQCEEDFVLLPHPLSFGGLIPIPPSCEPDGEKARKVKAVADRAVETLRQRRADTECGIAIDEAGRKIPAEVPEKELKKEVAKNKRRGMTDAEFEDLWKGAIGELVGREEVTSSTDGRLLSSSSLARLPVGCTIKRSARLALARNKQSISLLTVVLLLALYTRNRIITNRTDAARVPALVSEALDRLATQAALHARDDVAEPWISAGQLRDDILRDIFSDSRRESVWTRVRNIVEKNANVRASVREGRGGDISRVWEWIGSLGILDEQPLEKRRSTGNHKRVSFGGLKEESPDRRQLQGGTDSDSVIREMAEKRKWDEGRPIY